MSATYGPLVRLWGVSSSQLPLSTATTQELTPFLTAILAETLPFISTVPTSTGPTSPSSPWIPKGRKTYSNSTAPVHLYERVVPAEALSGAAKDPPHVPNDPRLEAWFLRRSVHEDAAKTGTASWDEWLQCFKEEHAEAEEAFTPTVVSTNVRQQWDCTGVSISLDQGGETWVDWTLKLEESVHKIGAPLKNRLFPVLQATASVQGRKEFIVVQIAAQGPDDKEIEDKGVVRGAYTSVERIRQTAEGDTEWLMGTASDAKGVLPAWVQRLAVPSQVAKDVDMFLKWIATERKGKKNDEAVV